MDYFSIILSIPKFSYLYIFTYKFTLMIHLFLFSYVSSYTLAIKFQEIFNLSYIALSNYINFLCYKTLKPKWFWEDVYGLNEIIYYFHKILLLFRNYFIFISIKFCVKPYLVLLSSIREYLDFDYLFVQILIDLCFQVFIKFFTYLLL